METIYGVLGSVIDKRRLSWIAKLVLLAVMLVGRISSAWAADPYTIRFIYDCGGGEQECAVMQRPSGAPFQFLPQDPFCAEHNFLYWKNKATGLVVNENTTVTGDMEILAVFEDINLYTITVDYYFHDCVNNVDEVFDRAIYVVDGTKVTADHPFSITSPAQTPVPSAVQSCAGASENIFYPEEQTINITPADLSLADANHNLSKSVKYVPFTATYSYVYMLKNLTGNGYTEIPNTRVEKHGVRYSTVTADVLDFPYADFESTRPKRITHETGDTIHVNYTRKSFQLIFNSLGGSAVNPITKKYGESVSMNGVSEPTRVGYDFAGWYLDEDCTQSVGNSITLEDNTTIYAKWDGKNVAITYVYLFEKYNLLNNLF